VYDSKQESREFVGQTYADALAKACSFFGADEGDLEIVEVRAAEVSGLAARTLVVATPRGGTRRRSVSPEPRREREARPPKGTEARGNSARESEPVLKPTREESAPSVGTARSELTALGEFISGVIERIDLGPFEISENEEEDFVVFSLRGSAIERLTEGESRTLDAVQFLANQVSLRLGGEQPRRVVIDAEGNAARREAYLTKLADRAAQRAWDSERAVALDPMNSKDRRTIHVALRDTEGIATMSVGSGRYRQVLVVPEDAPEYEEARRLSAASLPTEP